MQCPVRHEHCTMMTANRIDLNDQNTTYCQLTNESWKFEENYTLTIHQELYIKNNQQIQKRFEDIRSTKSRLKNRALSKDAHQRKEIKYNYILAHKLKVHLQFNR